MKITSQPNERVTLYLPTKDRYGLPVQNMERWADEAIMVLGSIAGGATRLPEAEGFWFAEDTGQVIREKVHIVFANVNPQRFHNQQAQVLAFMERFGTATGQQTVAAEYDGHLHFMQITHANKIN